LEQAEQVECLDKLSRELAEGNNQDSSTSNWTVSETLSPVDYSPTVTAAISSQAGAKDAPATFVIRCRGHRTDVLVGTEGSWRAPRTNQLQVDFGINGEPAVRMPWLASSDGRTAIFKADAVRFLRSLPDGGWIMVRVFDWQGAAHEASFQLAGLDAIRKKIASACKWAPPVDGTAPAER